MSSVRKQMTVLMTADAVGGVWNYALELARATGSRAQIHLACMGPEPGADQKQAAAALSNLELYTRPCRLEWMPQPWKEVEEAGDWLLDLADEIRPDLIHLNNYTHAALPWQSPTLVVCHSCVYTWWQAVKGHRPPTVEWREYYERVRAGLQAADLVVGITHAHLQAMQSCYGFDGQQTVVYNGIPIHAFRAEPGRQLVLSAGRLWDEAKNMRIWEEVTPPGSWRVELAGEARNPGTGKSVHISGVSQPGRLSGATFRQRLRQAAIFVHPALYEPFGLAPLEAARSGCCLLLSGIDTLREIWGDSALYFDPKHPPSLEKQLHRLANDRGLARKMARKAGYRARRFNATASAGRYYRIYRRLSGANEKISTETERTYL